MKTRLRSSHLFGLISIAAVLIGIVSLVFGAEQKQARVTEVVRDVHLLAGQSAARAAIVSDTVHEGTAVRTGSDSRAELTFVDRTLTRLGANTVFSFGAAAHTYDLGSGAILITAPPSAGTVKISTAVATCAVSGFTAFMERHSNNWNKFGLLHGSGWVKMKGLPDEPCELHTGQMVVFPPHPTHCPQVFDFDISKLLNGKLIKGFKTQLPEFDLIVRNSDNQQHNPPPGGGGLVDPTNQNSLDQASTAHMESPPPMPTPMPTFTGTPPQRPGRQRP